MLKNESGNVQNSFASLREKNILLGIWWAKKSNDIVIFFLKLTFMKIS